MINFCALKSAWRGAPRFFLRLGDILKWAGKNARPFQKPVIRKELCLGKSTLGIASFGSLAIKLEGSQQSYTGN